MKRTVLVFGTLLAMVFFFGQTVSSTGGVYAQSQARVQSQTGDCENDCDGEPDQERLQDGSCKTVVTIAADCDGTQIQDQNHDKDGGNDGIQTRTGRA